MTLPAHRSASPARRRAVEILREVVERHGRATHLLAAKTSGLSADDHDLVRQIVLGVLRHRDALDSEIARASRVPLRKLAPPLREIFEVALYQVRHLDRVPDYAAVDEAVRQARTSGGEGAARFVNAVLRNLLRSAPPADENGSADAVSLARRFSHPGFLVARWLERFGPATTREVLAADNEPSGLDLMANPRRTDRMALAASLRAEGVVTEPSLLSPLGLLVRSGNPLRSPLLMAGHFSVQDEAAQVLPLLLPASDALLDVAAAPGGKSFAAVSLGRAHRVTALDRSVTRLRRVWEARARLGIPEVSPVAADILAAPLKAGSFDRVLFDAPCSGTGTLRKNPEIRLRIGPDAIERLARVQEAGLAAAAVLVSPGGYLLYATCSLEEEENERVVARVLAARPELEPADIASPGAWPGAVRGPLFRVFPGPSQDGFTAHLLRRRSGAKGPLDR